jgi:hypothetical protein
VRPRWFNRRRSCAGIATGFKAFWRWKCRNRAGQPRIDRGLRDLIQRMNRENPLWGASRIHGELLMLGFEVAQSTVSKDMARGRKPPSQSWNTFLRNHEAVAAIDMCVVPTVSFDGKSLICECPLMALSGHSIRAHGCPLLGVKLTCNAGDVPARPAMLISTQCSSSEAINTSRASVDM